MSRPAAFAISKVRSGLGRPWSAQVGCACSTASSTAWYLPWRLAASSSFTTWSEPWVERRVADDEPDVVGVLRHQALDDRIERAAGLAGRVEELDDRDRRALRPEHRRVHAHQPRLFGAHRLVLGALCLLAIQADAQGEGSDHKDQDAAMATFLVFMIGSFAGTRAGRRRWR